MIRLPVRAPFRLDLTANALRRLSTNVVDRFADGTYRRALATPAGTAIVSVTQPTPDALAIDVRGDRADTDAVLAFVRQSLGTDIDTAPFRAAAQRVPWLDELAGRLRGLQPPRYPTLWEACVNAIVFQQISIHAAAAILGRTIRGLGTAIADDDGEPLFVFPEAEKLIACDPERLRSYGLSVNKVVALREIAAHIVAGTLVEAPLVGRSTPEVIAELVKYRGIGPWTAAVICLRGLGRLDIFPEKDSGVARSMKLISGDAAIDGPNVVALLGAQRGMLYYHLLLGRLVARGEVPL